nr:MAG TPA: hypothetical protein [Caudoviricetes sp.]
MKKSELYCSAMFVGAFTFLLTQHGYIIQIV